MSGPTRGDELYETYSGSIDWSRTKVDDLRFLADHVSEGWPVPDDLDEDQVANLLRAKADKIEAALRTIENETHEDYNQLVKAIQWTQTGDYGPDKVREAWESYGENHG